MCGRCTSKLSIMPFPLLFQCSTHTINGRQNELKQLNIHILILHSLAMRHKLKTNTEKYFCSSRNGKWYAAVLYITKQPNKSIPTLRAIIVGFSFFSLYLSVHSFSPQRHDFSLQTSKRNVCICSNLLRQM